MRPRQTGRAALVGDERAGDGALTGSGWWRFGGGEARQPPEPRRAARSWPTTSSRVAGDNSLKGEHRQTEDVGLDQLARRGGCRSSVDNAIDCAADARRWRRIARLFGIEREPLDPVDRPHRAANPISSSSDETTSAQQSVERGAATRYLR
jgi:hypothetical protein